MEAFEIAGETGPRTINDARSRELYERATRVLVGGVNSPVRAMRAVNREPIFVERAEGAELVDVDGNRYIDYVCSWGAMIVGHADPRVLEAIASAAARGTSYGAPTVAEVELAERVAERVPSAEMVRLVSSGTEAAMTALRLARSITGRDKVIKFAGSYHGHVDGLLVDAGSGLATAGIPASPGVTAAAAGEVTVVAWNDHTAFEGAIERIGSSLAAVIAEPIAANMGVVPAHPGFLQLLRQRCDATGALMICDEVITGFRVARGGAQELLDLRPDITMLGKVLGGGLPLAAVAGQRGLMERLAPVGETYQAGTLSGNPLATAAGLATLELLDAASYDRLERTTERLARGLRQQAAAAGVAAHVPAVCGLVNVFFSEHSVSSYEDARTSGVERYARFFNEMLARGIYLPPSAFEAWFPSLAHTDEQVDRTIEAAGESFAALSES